MDKQQLESQLRQLSVELGVRLKRKEWRIACAESCTGGLLAKAITDIAGSSAWFERGVIAYSNEAKQQLLNVEPETFVRYGAVSEPVVAQMAEGMLKSARTDIVVAMSGITGPGGGTAEKPVGTVWFSWLTQSGLCYCDCRRFDGDRETVRLQTAIWAIDVALMKFI